MACLHCCWTTIYIVGDFRQPLDTGCFTYYHFLNIHIFCEPISILLANFNNHSKTDYHSLLTDTAYNENSAWAGAKWEQILRDKLHVTAPFHRQWWVQRTKRDISLVTLSASATNDPQNAPAMHCFPGTRRPISQERSVSDLPTQTPRLWSVHRPDSRSLSERCLNRYRNFCHLSSHVKTWKSLRPSSSCTASN